ncbi:MAG: ATP-binding cassette domain-containing protein, partial [Rhodospirillaceae bacterium]|nr:ATP-binding cassette domain-containing protein [Rhodospirillaceae bacterium]
MTQAETILRVTGVSKSFGGIQAVQNVSFDLRAGEIVALIGPNGAGKTTLVNVMTGTETADAGAISCDGVDITRQRPFQAARRGIARTFQIVQPFPEMSVVENVSAGALFAANAKSRAAAEEEAMAHLEFVGLGDLARTPAASLTLPNRKRLELAKSLAMKPRVLLLDE